MILIVVFQDFAQGTASSHSHTIGYGKVSAYIAHWCQNCCHKTVNPSLKFVISAKYLIVQLQEQDKRSIFQGEPDKFLKRLFCCLNKLVVQSSLVLLPTVTIRIRIRPCGTIFSSVDSLTCRLSVSKVKFPQM